MTAIMPIDGPRPRGTMHGERAHRRRVREAEPDSQVKVAQQSKGGGRHAYSRSLSCGLLMRLPRKRSRSAVNRRSNRRNIIAATACSTDAAG
jgi:hypothetical protein